MKPTLKLLLGIILCIIVIGGAYLWATSIMDSVYAYRSPLQSAPPQFGEPIGNPNTRSLVIVLIDGLRYDTSLDPGVMPYLNELRSKGASARMHSRAPSYSQPSYGTLLTGAWPELNDAPAINLDYAQIPTFTQDDIFSAAHRTGLATAISGFNWFEKLVPQQAVATSFYTSGEDQVADRQVTNAALPWLGEGKYQLILIHLDQVDYAGHHEGGAKDARWTAAALRSDDLLKEITSAIDLSLDTLLVVSDHGHLAQGGHGGQDADILLEPFVLVGRGVRPGNYGDVQMVDVALTMAAILGTNIPATNQGQPRTEMLDLSDSQLNIINSRITVQQEKLARDYGNAINQPVKIIDTGATVLDTQTGIENARNAKLFGQQIIRGIFGILLGIIFLYFGLRNTRPYTTWTLIAIASYLIMFNLKYVFIDQKTYSLSSVISSGDLISSTAITSGICLVISWLLFFIGTKALKLPYAQAGIATLKMILGLLAVLSVPILIHFIINGAIVTWTLPDFLLSFLGLLFLIQMLVVAAIGIFITFLSMLVGIFNQHRYQTQVA